METMRELYERVRRQEQERGRSFPDWEDDGEMDCLLHPSRTKEKVSTAADRDWQMETLSADALAVANELKQGEKKLYALIAPAFMGQFGDEATPGKVRAALKEVGFTGMVEVAVFADILTLKEALEFDAHIKSAEDFQLTSCCCPVWITMIRDVFREYMPHVPGAVSPMIAAGRATKKLHPDAVTVFLGPCMAKKKEAKEPDIADAVDHVLTFQEVGALFEAAGVRPEEMTEDDKEHSSAAGRIYARTGGVSEAVKRTVAQLNPARAISVVPKQADGVKACREMIEQIKSGAMDANFYEGMACQGGCVGGPKSLCGAESGRERVNRYGEEAVYQTPLENPYVLALIEKLGFYTVDDFLKKSDILTRDFS